MSIMRRKFLLYLQKIQPDLPVVFTAIFALLFINIYKPSNLPGGT